MWQYERDRPAFSLREIELGEQVSKGPMSQRFSACREILSYDTNNQPLLQRCRNCGDRYPCQIKYCDKCYDKPLDPSNWHVDPSSFISEDVLNPIKYSQHVGHGAFRHVQRVQRMMEPFYGVPISQIAPFTAKFCYLQGGEDYVAVKKFYHQWMREISVGFRDLVHPGVKLVYRFEWSWTTAGDAASRLPLRAPGVADVTTMDPNQVVAFLHCHGLAHFPGFTYSEAGQFFRMVFDGPAQIHVATPRTDSLGGVAGSESRLLEVEKQAFIHDRKTNLPDHPEDADHWLGIAPYRQTVATTVDQRLDALAAAHRVEDEASHCPEADALARASGLAGFFNYACKEHLPKAQSRYHRLADEIATGNAAGDREHTSNRKLTPEQMIVACHGDAELKRAFHGQRLTHTFGTIKKSKPKKSDQSQATQPDVATADHLTNQDVLNGIEGTSQPGWVATISSQYKTAVARCMGLHSKLYGLLQFSWHDKPQIEHAQTSYTKEGGHSVLASPFFSWPRSILRFTLRLGMRLLRPP